MNDFTQDEFNIFQKYFPVANELTKQYHVAKPIADVDNIEVLKAISVSDPYLADHHYEIIMEAIKKFEEDLDDEHEVCLRLTSFGQSITLSVTNIGYHNPSTIMFYGYVGSQPATLIQHINQLNFLLLAVKKSDPEKPARRIGFSLTTED